MKKTAFVLTALLALCAFGDGKKMNFPTADFISAAMTYTGKGRITRTAYDAQKFPTWKVFVKGATLAEMQSYVASLKAAGFRYQDTLDGAEPASVRFAGDYAKWSGTNGAQSVDIQLMNEDASAASTWNLKIVLADGDLFAY